MGRTRDEAEVLTWQQRFGVENDEDEDGSGSDTIRGEPYTWEQEDASSEESQTEADDQDPNSGMWGTDWKLFSVWIPSILDSIKCLRTMSPERSARGPMSMESLQTLLNFVSKTFAATLPAPGGDHMKVHVVKKNVNKLANS